MTNRLAEESSPYLQQHKDNPVNWWPYCDEAFEQAKKEDKPVFISIGYSTCHWCHVMEKESFSDPKTAEFMNEHFINIKVDREERPDVDRVYQRYYNSMTGGSGGWPLSVWAFPDGLPFMIGTYFPNSFNLRTRRFMSINKEIVESWENERDDLYETALGLSRNLDSSNQIMITKKASINDSLILNELKDVQQRFDWRNGGIDQDPKFPRFPLLRFILQEGVQRDADNLIDFVRFTYHQMGKGGIYDQLGGGISRYSVDEKWLIPHFEKMLYDQAGFLRLGAQLFGVTKDPFVEFLVQDTISFLKRRMKDESGVYYSAIDAESEGKEGRFYVWKHFEMKEVLCNNYQYLHVPLPIFPFTIDKPGIFLNEDWKIAKLRFGITRRGNFSDPRSGIRGANVLHIDKSVADIAEELNRSPQYISNRLNEINSKLFKAREKRERPFIDKKIITTWNSMLITGLIEVGEKLQNDEAIDLAIPALEFLLKHCYDGDRVIRSLIKNEDGFENSGIEGVLDDYAMLIQALIQAYEYTDTWRYIEKAEQILQLADKLFWDPDDKIYYYNQKSAEDTIGRVMSAMDDTFESALAVMIQNLHKLSNYLENAKYKAKGQTMLQQLADPLENYDAALNEMLIAATQYLRYPEEIVIVNDNNKKFDEQILKKYFPNRLIYRWKNDDDSIDDDSTKPMWNVLTNRTDVDKPTVYVCEGSKCTLPITSSEELNLQLESPEFEKQTRSNTNF